jgi:hypothetical protein
MQEPGLAAAPADGQGQLSFDEPLVEIQTLQRFLARQGELSL